jgi:hypothetical protein
MHKNGFSFKLMKFNFDYVYLNAAQGISVACADAVRPELLDAKSQAFLPPRAI